MPKKFKWDPGPVLLQDACTTGDLERVRTIIEKHHVPVDACSDYPIPFSELLPGMVVTMTPQGLQGRFTGEVVSKTEDSAMIIWNAPNRQGPPGEVGKAQYPRDREEMRLWWDEAGNATHALANDRYDCTGLHYASAYGRLELVKYLLERGANVNGTSRGDEDNPGGGGHTPLMCAAHNGHQGVVRALLDAGADVTMLNSAFRCAGDYARDAGHNSIANLLDQLVSKQFVAKDVPTAVVSGDVLWLKDALRNGKVTMDWKHGGTQEGILATSVRACMDAVGAGPVRRARRMLDFLFFLDVPGVNDRIVPQDSGGPATLLMLAASRGRCELVRLLLAHGADPEATTLPEGGKTAVQLAPPECEDVQAVLNAQMAQRAVVAHLATKREAQLAGEDERRDWCRDLKRLKQSAAEREQEAAKFIAAFD
eukprot:TRINITY_DN17486_c0_g1_i1.p1 TRINITY_DN17486_c0_g1~~TRINITY_DN17486_c0_g1_i1.p1  ORF type:complete len:448 (+),score=129.53 TRINITY_DN17486_c0_g1_i1:74-1345(+)